MKYPKYTDYEKMYKRYFDKGVEYLIEKADLKRDDKVLDMTYKTKMFDLTKSLRGLKLWLI